MPNTTPITMKVGRGIVVLVVIGMFVQLGLLAYVFYSSYEGRRAGVTYNRQACRDRGRVANRANADFQNAQTKYIKKVIFDSPSVKEDVKSHAREAVRVFKRTSKTLTNLAHVNCKNAYPNARFFP